MLRVTADIYSGRPNPEWIIDDQEAAAVLRELAQQPAAAAALDAGFQGLGNRGLVVEALSDNVEAEYGVPATFRLAAGTGRGSGKATELAERLIRRLPDRPQPAGGQPAANMAVAEGFDSGLRELLLNQLAAAPTATTTESTVSPDTPAADAPAGGADSSATAAAPPVLFPVCTYEVTAFNPAFWNDPFSVTRNNCYNYATNRRTNTFAQPGRATGAMYAAINCAQVGAAAVHDGAVMSPKCALPSENPRWYMALVVIPGGGDYHWYRRSQGGLWTHKPGGTPARNTDNSGHLIPDPRTADRGPYTTFCGFFFAQRRMVVK